MKRTDKQALQRSLSTHVLSSSDILYKFGDVQAIFGIAAHAQKTIL